MKLWEFVFPVKQVSNLEIHKLAPVSIMIRTNIVVTLLFIAFIGICQANNCFDKSSCKMIDQTKESYFYIMNVEFMEITNYHCIMKCANTLSKVTMDLAMDNMQDKFNHQCILIENLDFCVQYWKKKRNVDCEVPIKNMVKQNFQVWNIWLSLIKESLSKNVLFSRLHRIHLIVSTNTSMVPTPPNFKMLHCKL